MTSVIGPGNRQTGTTLAEMVVVVAVVAVAAALAIPRTNPQAAFAADAVAAEVARALRFAQREAVRTGTYQQISVDPATQLLRVYQPNASTGLTATHPVDKRPYQISFAGNAMPRATIVSAVFNYEGGPTTNYASFGPDGTPSYVDPSKLSQLWSALFGTKDVDPLKDEGKITIRYGNIERVVRVAPVTGRVVFLKVRAGQHGFSFVEIMVAVLLLAICAVPMGDAIRNGITASSIATAKARELRCIKNTMETVLAQPYQNLWNAARNPGEAAVLSLPADASCEAPPRLSIAKYEYDATSKKLTKLPASASPERLESPLLYITLTAANDGYAFTTLVAR